MTDPKRITKDDLEKKFKALQTDIQGRVSDKKQSLIAVGSAVGTLLFIVAYLLGRRSGRRRNSRVEFRRF